MLLLPIYLSLADNEDDKSKIEQLYREYVYDMLYVANLILKNKYDAEEAVHNVFVRLSIKPDIVCTDEPRKTRALMIIMAKQSAYKLCKKAKKRDENITLIEKEFLEVMNVDPVDYEAEVISSVLFNQYKKDIWKLGPKYSYPLVLRILRLSYSEIESILGIKESTVRVQVKRAREMLKNYWREEK